MSDSAKTLAFNPSGFILKIIICIVCAVFYAKTAFTGLEDPTPIKYVQEILQMLLSIILIYDVCSLFGFALRTTGNYFIAAILWLILLVLVCVASSELDKLINFENEALTKVVKFASECILIVLFTLPLLSDIKKAVLYFKNTV